MAKNLTFLFIVLLFSGKIVSQTGIFWYGDTTSEFVNNRIIAIKENAAGEIFLMGKASDRDFKNNHAWWGSVLKNGKLKFQKTLEAKYPVYELNHFTICDVNKIRMWGTEKVNGKLTIMIKTIDVRGELIGEDAMMTNTTTLTGDVFQLNDSLALFAKTVQSSTTGKFHISYYKYNVKNDGQLWYKKIVAEPNTPEVNEEASKFLVMKDGSIILLAKLYNDDLSAYSAIMYKIKSTGEMTWRKELESYPSFVQQGISEGKNGQLIHFSSMANEQEVLGKTKITVMDTAGKIISTTELKDIRANGILQLKNGNILLYGAKYIKGGMYIVTKGSFQLLDQNLKQIKTDELGLFDAPDAILPSLAMTTKPTSSDFITALQLKDGRLAMGGRVYMPENGAPDKIILSPRINKAFLILAEVNGKFRPE